MRDNGLNLRRRDFLAAGVTLVASTAVGCSTPTTETATRTTTSSPAPPRAPTAVGLAAGSALLWASDNDLRRTLDAAVQAGVSIIRFDVSWTFAEPYRGRYEWAPSNRIVKAAVERRLRPLVTITNSPSWAAVGGWRQTGRPTDPATYADFAGTVAEHYRDSVDVFEIWNEPNGRMFFEPMPDPVVYAQMLRLAYQRIKAVHPDSTVLGGALGAVDHTPDTLAPVSFLQGMYTAGAHDHFDALSFHPYDYSAPLATGALYPNSPMSQMAAMYEVMARNGDGTKQIWITEYGAPSSRIGPAAQADLIANSLRQWQEVDYAGPFIVHTIRDDDTAALPDERTFGVVGSDYTPKPAFTQLQSLLAPGAHLSRDVDADFRGNRDAALGAAVTPVFNLKEGTGQRFERGYRYSTATGFINAPVDVGAKALQWQLVPNTEFANGYQDFGGSALRIFSHPQFGTRAIFGAILAAWTPELGAPTSDEHPVAPGGAARAVDFEHGTISWSEADGAKVSIR